MRGGSATLFALLVGLLVASGFLGPPVDWVWFSLGAAFIAACALAQLGWRRGGQGPADRAAGALRRSRLGSVDRPSESKRRSWQWCPVEATARSEGPTRLGVMVPATAARTVLHAPGRRCLARRTRRLLAGLGPNSDAVAQSLLLAGIRAERGDPEDGPLMAYLSVVIGADPAVASVIVKAPSVTIFRSAL